MTVQLTRYQQDLVIEFEPMARRLATKIWRQRGGDLEEMTSEAFQGLVDSAIRYDGSRPFPAFAVLRITGAIKDAARRRDHVPRSVRTRYKEGDESVVAQVEASPITLEAVELGLADPADTQRQASENSIVAMAGLVITSLPADQQLILALHYYVGLPLQDVADTLHVPESRVGKLHIRAVLTLRETMLMQLSTESTQQPPTKEKPKWNH